MPEINEAQAALEKQLHDIKELLAQSAHRDEVRDKTITDLQKRLDDANEARKAQVKRKLEFGIPSEDDDSDGYDPKPRGMKAIVQRHAYTPEQQELHRVNDEIYLMSQILKTHPAKLKSFDLLEANTAVSQLRKAMDTATAGEGYEWVPTGFSATMFETIKLELQVAAMHESIPMPSKVYKPPTLDLAMTSHYEPEALVDEAVKITTSQVVTGDFTLTARKHAVRTVWSDELTEDSIAPILPVVQRGIAQAIAEGRERCTIDGDTTATHQDSDVTSAKDNRKMWKGYRKLAIAAAKSDLATMSTANIIALRKKMGKYGVDGKRLFFVTSINSWYSMMGLTEVLTVEKYGPNAVVLSGELGRFLNIPILISEKYRADLNATGVYDAATMTKTGLAIVRRDCFYYGDRRSIRVRLTIDPNTEQQILVASERVDFQSPFNTTTEPMVAVGYNITS